MFLRMFPNTTLSRLKETKRARLRSTSSRTFRLQQLEQRCYFAADLDFALPEPIQFDSYESSEWIFDAQAEVDQPTRQPLEAPVEVTGLVRFFVIDASGLASFPAQRNSSEPFAIAIEFDTKAIQSLDHLVVKVNLHFRSNELKFLDIATDESTNAAILANAPGRVLLPTLFSSKSLLSFQVSENAPSREAFPQSSSFGAELQVVDVWVSSQGADTQNSLALPESSDIATWIIVKCGKSQISEVCFSNSFEIPALGLGHESSDWSSSRFEDWLIASTKHELATDEVMLSGGPPEIVNRDETLPQVDLQGIQQLALSVSSTAGESAPAPPLKVVRKVDIPTLDIRDSLHGSRFDWTGSTIRASQVSQSGSLKQVVQDLDAGSAKPFTPSATRWIALPRGSRLQRSKIIIGRHSPEVAAAEASKVDSWQSDAGQFISTSFTKDSQQNTCIDKATQEPTGTCSPPTGTRIVGSAQITSRTKLVESIAASAPEAAGVNSLNELSSLAASILIAMGSASLKSRAAEEVAKSKMYDDRSINLRDN